MSRKALVPIQLPADPTLALEAVTKQYVDARAGSEVEVSATDPIGANPTTELWIDTVTNPPAAPLASGISFSPTGTIAATNVQSAIAEAAAEAMQTNVPWITLGSLLINGWINYTTPYGPSYYRKVGDIVYLRGLVSSGSPASANICILPAGYRPLYDVIISTPCNLGVAEIRVTTAGAVYCPSSVPSGVGLPATWLSLSGVFFSTIT